MDNRNDQDQPRPLDPVKAPQRENDPALVFAQNYYGVEQQGQQKHQPEPEKGQHFGTHHSSPLGLPAGLTVRNSPSAFSTSTVWPAAMGSSDRALQSSPSIRS